MSRSLFNILFAVSWLLILFAVGGIAILAAGPSNSYFISIPIGVVIGWNTMGLHREMTRRFVKE